MSAQNLHSYTALRDRHGTSGVTWIADSSYFYPQPFAYTYDQSLYLLKCIHCNEKFVTTPRRSQSCIQSLETCWDVTCPKCEQELRLCLHECRYDCEHALDCLTLGIIEKVLEQGFKLEFEQGAKVQRRSPFEGPVVQYPWISTADTIYGNTSIGVGTGFNNNSAGSNTAVTISFMDKVKQQLELAATSSTSDTED